MFELSFALKYLIPKRKQLSTSLIAFLSIVVISLVIWLLLLFLSLTEGMERAWLKKLTALHGSLRVHPTEAYFHSYYYLIDKYASGSDYTLKTIAQKKATLSPDPYDITLDAELPQNFPEPVRKKDGSLLDPVKELYAVLDAFPSQVEGFCFQEVTLGGALMHLNASQGDVYQATYVATIPEKSRQFVAMIEEGAIDTTSTTPPRILLPKSMKENGATVGSSGTLSYSAWTAGSFQEQRLPFVVSGFYNPGLLPIGNRAALVPQEVISLIHATASSFQMNPREADGVVIWCDTPQDVEYAKKTILNELRKRGIESYWTVTSFRDYPFAKEVLQQFQSDKLLFTLIGIVILMMAMSNIISLLLFLVHDKKREIGILTAMGASKRSISLIFAFAGTMIGSIGSLMGIAATSLTLHFIHPIVDSLRFLQANNAFQLEMFSGSYPTQLSGDALLLVLILTPILSCLAALIPAWKASHVQPFHTLKTTL